MANFLVVYPGMVAVFVLTILLMIRWLRLPADRKHTEWLLVVTLLVEPAGMLCQATANGISVLEPMKYDLYIYRIDEALGFHSFWLGEAVAHLPSLRVLVSVSYGLLAVAMLSVFAANLLWESEAAALKVARTLALNLFLALPIYLLIPVCGPQFAFPAFPAWPGAIAAHPLAIAAAPNGIPSVHTSSALLVLWFLRKWKLGRVAGVLFLALTVFATLSSGQHYVFDLLCAVPYATFLIWLHEQRTDSSAIELAPISLFPIAPL
jgi:hypothetical protein